MRRHSWPTRGNAKAVQNAIYCPPGYTVVFLYNKEDEVVSICRRKYHRDHKIVHREVGE